MDEGKNGCGIMKEKPVLSLGQRCCSGHFTQKKTAQILSNLEI